MTWVKLPWSAGLLGRWVLIDQVNQDNLVDQWNDILDVLGGMTLFFFSFSPEGEMKSLTMTIVVNISHYKLLTVRQQRILFSGKSSL